MANNRNPYFKVYVGDEMRLLLRLSTEAYGFYCILRNWVHDAKPYGHIVDGHGIPLDGDALMDMSRLKASNFRAAFHDLREMKCVQGAAAWLAEVQTREYPKYVEIASQLVAGVRSIAIVGNQTGIEPTPEALLVPALADQFVRTSLGQKTGGTRKSGDVTPPVTGDVRKFPTTRADAQSQKSKSESESKAESTSPASEREREATTTARAQVEISEPMARWLRIQVKEIRQNSSLMTMAIADPDAYEEAVRTMTGYSPEEVAQLTGDDGILALEIQVEPHPGRSSFVVRWRPAKPKAPSNQTEFSFIRVGESA